MGTASELIRSFRVVPANIHQSIPGIDIIKELEAKKPSHVYLLFVDAAYDDKKCYSSAIESLLVPCIAYNRKKSDTNHFMSLSMSNWRKQSLGIESISLRQQYYYLRSAVERYNSVFKDLLKGRSIPVRSLVKVKNYLLGITILSQLYGLVNWTLQHLEVTNTRRILLYYLSI